jgi:hypothetical protein
MYIIYIYIIYIYSYAVNIYSIYRNRLNILNLSGPPLSLFPYRLPRRRGPNSALADAELVRNGSRGQPGGQQLASDFISTAIENGDL